MQSVLDAEMVLVQIQEQAERIKSDETQRFPEAASPGDAWRQGDIYITLLGELPSAVQKTRKPKRQLAPGTSQGSRHCLDSLNGVQMYEQVVGSLLSGPIIVCNTTRTITHPEHGDVVLPPGIYSISYQRSLDGMNREYRVLD